MNTTVFSLVSTVVFLIVSNRVRAQGTFVNLDFEAANVADLPPGTGEVVAVTNGAPGWNVVPSNPLGYMGHNNMSLGGADVEIFGPQWPSDQIFQGRYTVGLFSSIAGPPTSAWIDQTGQLPTTAKSIEFYGSGSFTVTFAGQQVFIAPVGSGPNYTIFGGDISGFAGQTGELRFTAPIGGGGLLDNIQLSNQSVPEPTVFALLALGMVALGLSRRRKGR